MKWTWQDGHEKMGPDGTARSSLPCPNVIRDNLLEPLQHMANGRMYDSKRAMEKADRDAGCICVGNEQPNQAKPEPMPDYKDDVIEAYKKVRDGYKPGCVIEKSVPPESGWI